MAKQQEGLIEVSQPHCEVHRFAFSSEFKLYNAEQIRHIDPRLRHCQQLTMGGIYTQNGKYVSLSDRQGGSLWDQVGSIDPPILAGPAIGDVAILPGKTLYLGYYMNHYGHFITESLSRFWALEADIQYDNYVFFPFIFNAGQIMNYGFHKYFLGRFGLLGKNVVYLKSPLRFEEIHVPKPLAVINASANLNYKKTYDSVSRPLRTGPPGRLVFLSRVLPYARIANVPEIEAVFSELGFEIIYPETMKIEEQMACYANARVLAAFAGSALHNCVFCEPGTQIIELGDIRSPSEPLIMQKVLNQLSRVEAEYIPFSGTEDGAMDVGIVKMVATTILGRQQTGTSRHQVAGRYSLRWPASLTAHMAGLGDIYPIGELTAGDISGPTHEIEGFAITLDKDAPFGIEYKSLNAADAWTPWLPGGSFAGVRGMSSSLRGFAVRLTGKQAYRFECVCIGGFLGEKNLIEVVQGELCVSPNRAPLISMRLLLRHL